VVVACAICEVRREKRFCLALHDRICPQCCGQEREVTLDCPSECVYLQQARRHERPREAPGLEQTALLFPQVEIPEKFLYEREPLIVGLSYGLAKTTRSREVNDRDVISALTALAKTYETLIGSGLVYESPTPSMAQQAMVAELQKMIAEYRDLEKKQLGYSALKDSEAMRAVVFLLRMAQGRTSGRPRSRAFIDFIHAQFPQKESVITSPHEGGRIVMP
jgi:hypothetical protein